MMKGIGAILKEKSLVVPRYQRSYAWEKKHVNDLLQDISTAMRSDQEEYFLGSIVLLEEDGKLHVVDGQQRLATCTILIAAIRNYFSREKEDHRAAQVESSYLMSKDLRTQDVEPNLRMNHEDHTFYEESILKTVTDKDRKKIEMRTDSHRKLFDAYEITRKHINAEASSVSNPIGVLVDWLEFLENQVKVIRVQVPDGANAFTIFETLNDRGLDLAISDLLKNYLFNRAGNRIDEAQHQWTEMIGALSVVDADRQIVPYIRHVWSTRHGLIRERDLYQSIKKQATGSQSAMDLVTLFSSGAPLYAAILKPTPDCWRDFGVEALRHMETLNMLRMTQVRPLLLAVLKNFKPAEVVISMKFMVSWAVRFYILGRLGSGDLEKFYANMAKAVATGGITTGAKLRAAAKDTVPTDAVFKDAFSNASVGKSYLSRYYLRALEQSSNNPPTYEFKPNDDPSLVDLEHIMPESPSKDWNLAPEVAQTYTNRLGNLVLLVKEDNSAIGNKPFAHKKQVYSKSAFNLTRKAGTYEAWSSAEIDDRQRYLAEIALKTWPI